MKKILALLTLTIFIFSVAALYVTASESIAYDGSYESHEPESKNYQWAYYLVGGVALVAVIGSVIYITKKK